MMGYVFSLDREKLSFFKVKVHNPTKKNENNIYSQF